MIKIERLGCCTLGHVTYPSWGKGGVRRCHRYKAAQPCPAAVVMLTNVPAVEAYVRLVGGTYSESVVFKMLADLHAWGDATPADGPVEDQPPG